MSLIVIVIIAQAVSSTLAWLGFYVGIRALPGAKARQSRWIPSLLLLPSAAGVAAAWIFSLWGSGDILNAFYQANHAGLLAGQLGAAYFLPTLVVPLLLITHGLAFRILLQQQPELAVRESRHLA